MSIVSGRIIISMRQSSATGFSKGLCTSGLVAFRIRHTRALQRGAVVALIGCRMLPASCDRIWRRLVVQVCGARLMGRTVPLVRSQSVHGGFHLRDVGGAWAGMNRLAWENRCTEEKNCGDNRESVDECFQQLFLLPSYGRSRHYRVSRAPADENACLYCSGLDLPHQ